MCVIKTTRNNNGNNSICKESRIYFVLKRRYEIRKCGFVKGNKDKFVLKQNWLFQYDKG